MTTPESKEKPLPVRRGLDPDYRHARRRRALIAVAVLVLVGAIGFFVAKPAYRYFRVWKVGQNAVAAKEALAAGQYDEARRLAFSVLRMKRGNYEMLKVLQASMEHRGDPDAVLVAQMLMVHPEHTHQDRIDGFKKVCERQPMARVFKIWNVRMTTRERKDEAFFVPLATRLIDQKLYGYAKKFFFRCNGIDNQPELQMQRVRLLRESGDRIDLRDAQFEIGRIMARGGETALPAFRLLADIPWDQFESVYFPELDRWLDEQEGVTVNDRLIALVQRFARIPQYSSQIIDKAVAEYSARSPLEVADWLIRIGHPERALPLLPEQAGKSDLKIFRLRAAALAASEDWSALSKWLAGEPPGDCPSLEIHARRVIAAEHLGDTAVRTREWEAALRDAGGVTPENGFLELYRWMDDAGLDELARESMFAAIRLRRGCLPLFDQVSYLVPWLRQKRRGIDLLEFCRFMATLEPGNPLPVAVVLDVGCTSGNIDPETAIKGLRIIHEKYPEIKGIDDALATALLLAGRPDEALAEFPPDAVTRAKPSPYALAVTGVAMAMKGDEAESKKLLDRVPWDTMLVEECDAFYRIISDTRLAKSSQREKIREFTEAPPPAADERILKELRQKEESRRKLLKEFTESRRQPTDENMLEDLQKRKRLRLEFLEKFGEQKKRPADPREKAGE
jgi:hypothetical protein